MYRSAPPSAEQCSMRSSNTQSAAERSLSIAAGCIIAMTIWAICSSKTGRKALWCA